MQSNKTTGLVKKQGESVKHFQNNRTTNTTSENKATTSRNLNVHRKIPIVVNVEESTSTRNKKESNETKKRKPFEISTIFRKDGSKKGKPSVKTVIILSVVFCVLLIALIIGLVFLNQKNSCNGHGAEGNLEIEKNSCNMVSYFKPSKELKIVSIIIGSGSFQSANTFHVEGLRQLKTISVESECFTKVNENEQNFAPKPENSFSILNCPNLQYLSIAGYSFADWAGTFILENLPALEQIWFGSKFNSNAYSFHYKSLSIHGSYKVFR